MSDPEITFGKGPLQITFKGEKAISEGGWAIRYYLMARALAMLTTATATAALLYWRFGL